VTSIQRQLPLHESTTAYASAKAALSNYSKALSKEVAPHGVRVNRVSPGWVETEASGDFLREIASRNGTDETGAKELVMRALILLPGCARAESPIVGWVSPLRTQPRRLDDSGQPRAFCAGGSMMNSTSCLARVLTRSAIAIA
jgi:NAD(P)-dependent dehydrogenase (short-subunit alcohol dehydrogenase family)